MRLSSARRVVFLTAALISVPLVGLVAPALGAGSIGHVKEYSGGLSPDAGIADLVSAGPTSVAFAEFYGDQLGAISRTGAISEVQFPTGSGPRGVALGPDGATWLTLAGSGGIGRVSPSGRREIFTKGLPAGGLPQFITPGPDGDMWFTQSGVNAIGRVTPNGDITMVTEDLPSAPEFIVGGPDRRVWFTLPGTGQIGRLDADGSQRLFALPKGSGVWDLVVASGGALWFTDPVHDQVGRMSPGGRVSIFSQGISAGAAPLGIAVGPDGNVWFTEPQHNAIGRISPTGSVTEFTKGISPAAEPHGITAGPDGSMWFGELAGNRVARIATGARSPDNRFRAVARSTTRRGMSVTVHLPTPGWLTVFARSGSVYCSGGTIVRRKTVTVDCRWVGTPHAHRRPRVTFTPFGGNPRTVKAQPVVRGTG